MAHASTSAPENGSAPKPNAEPQPDPHQADYEADFEPWDAAEDAVLRDAALIVSLEGFEGPLDVLLALARTQKVDLAKISVLALAEQYLAFVAEAQKLRLELAADYLVMAAWLAFRLQRLNAMREVAAKLMTRKRLGRDVFARGMPEGVRTIRVRQYTAIIYDLLKAYADQRRRNVRRVHVIARRAVWSIKQARERLELALGTCDHWVEFDAYLAQYLAMPDLARTATASSFGAALEMAREGVVDISQAKPFAPIYVRRRANGEEQRRA